MAEALIHVGHSVDAINAAKTAILEILNAKADQKTIRAAFDAFHRSLGDVSGTTFSNVTINQAGPEKRSKK